MFFLYFLFCSWCFFTPTSPVYPARHHRCHAVSCALLCRAAPPDTPGDHWGSRSTPVYWCWAGIKKDGGGDSQCIVDMRKVQKEKREGKKSQETITGESNEMYQWLNYSPSHTPWQLNWAFLPPLVVHGAVSGTLQRPFNFGRPGEPVEQPAGGAVHPLLGGQGRGVPQVVRRTDAAWDPLAASAEGGSGQPEASWARSVTEGMEPRVLWPETGPNRVNERTGLLVGRRKDWQHPWGSNIDDVQRRMCYMREHYM